MPDTHHSHTQIKDDLIRNMDEITAGMLGVEGVGSHMRPMTHFADNDHRTLWFLASRSSDLVTEIGQGSTAHFCLVGDNNRFYACLRGTIEQVADDEKKDELWGPISGAWFEGQDDPDVVLLKMSLRDAEVWSNTDSRLQFAFEIARANVDSSHQPDVGEHGTVIF